MKIDDKPVFWDKTKQRTAYFLVGTVLLTVGTPFIVALTQPGARFYLLQPIVFLGQSLPNLLAAGLWLPWRSERARTVGLRLAALLFAASALLYIPVMTGITPTGGDMIALGYVLMALVTTAAILVATIVGFGVSWFIHRRRSSTIAG
jgi:hypothetical protein